MSYTITTACTGCSACLRLCPVNAILGERKTLHTIDPDLCIECGLCGRVCPAQAVLDASGQACQTVKRSAWFQPLILEKKCIACGICIQVCPTSALDFDPQTIHHRNSLPFLKDERNCIGCSFCQGNCPVGAIELQPFS